MFFHRYYALRNFSSDFSSSSPPSSWLAGLWWTNPIWPHHLVIFMFDNVAMPDELAWRAKSHSDSNDFSGIGNDSVLPAIFFRTRTSFLAY